MRHPAVPTMPARHHVRAGERVELLHGIHVVVVGAEERDLLTAHEGGGTAFGREVVEAADADPRGEGEACSLRRDVDGHRRTSRVVPAMSTPLVRSSGVAGRGWPRSAT